MIKTLPLSHCRGHFSQAPKSCLAPGPQGPQLAFPAVCWSTIVGCRRNPVSMATDPHHSKVIRRRTSVGRTQAGDVLITDMISKTAAGEARLCSHWQCPCSYLGSLTINFHSENNTAKDLLK